MSNIKIAGEWPVDKTEGIMLHKIKLLEEAAQLNKKEEEYEMAAIQQMCAATLVYTMANLPSVIPINKEKVNGLKRTYAHMIGNSMQLINQLRSKKRTVSSTFNESETKTEMEGDKITVNDCFGTQEWYINGDKWVENDKIINQKSEEVITFGSIVGQETAKETIKNNFIQSLVYPYLFGNLNRNVLMWGPPGTGKTTIAKAMINEIIVQSKDTIGVVFVSVTGSSLKDKYVGGSEKKIHTLFDCAEKLKNKANELNKNKRYITIIFIDEIESLTGERTEESGGSGGNTVNQLLTEMDGFVKRKDVYVVAATNKPWMIDDAINRRLHNSIYVGGVKNQEEMLEIVQLTIGGYYKKIFNSNNERLAYDQWKNIVYNETNINEFENTIKSFFKTGYSASNIESSVKNMISSTARNLIYNHHLYKIYEIGKLYGLSRNEINGSINQINGKQIKHTSDDNKSVFRFKYMDKKTKQQITKDITEYALNKKYELKKIDIPEKGIINNYFKNNNDFRKINDGSVYKIEGTSLKLVQAIEKMIFTDSEDEYATVFSIIDDSKETLYYMAVFIKNQLYQEYKSNQKEGLNLKHNFFNSKLYNSIYVTSISLEENSLNKYLNENEKENEITIVYNSFESINQQNIFALSLDVPQTSEEFYFGIQPNTDNYVKAYKSEKNEKVKNWIMND